MLNAAKPSVPPEALNVNPSNPDLIFYGPQPCSNCHRMVCKTSIEQGAIPFDYPQGEPIYPNTRWNKHVCSPQDDATMAQTDELIERTKQEQWALHQLHRLARKIFTVVDASVPQGKQHDAIESLIEKSFDEVADDVVEYCSGPEAEQGGYGWRKQDNE
jgi:hypothetical protein